MRGMLAKSWKGLWCFGEVPEEQWYDAMVYSECTPVETARDLSPTDRGMWWPCLAIYDGRRFRTWCQDFALNGARTTWDTSPNGRVHIYKHRNQPTPWAESTATAPSSGAASSSSPPPPPPQPTASAPSNRGMWWAPPPPPPAPPTASAPPPPPQAAPSSGAAEQSPEPDYVWTTTVVIEDLSDTEMSEDQMIEDLFDNRDD